VSAATSEARSVADVATGPAVGRAALALGVFDGVHRGHRALLSATREAAAARGARPVALVFDPPPVEVIRPGFRLARLAPLDENIAAVAGSGVQPVAVRFDEAVRELAAEDFLAALQPAVEPVAVVMTPFTAFGHERAGTPERLARIAARRGFQVVVIDPETDDGPISSSRIRRALADGEPGLAARLLGRRPAVSGTVVHGDGRGRELGYPTANLGFAYHPALPALGIYAGYLDGRPALVSIGRRPQFHEAGEVVVEAHVLDWEGDLYGHQVRLELGHRLRDEQRFASVGALVAQMQRDEEAARRAFGGLV